MTDRIKRMRERLQTMTFPLCIDRMRASFPIMEAMKGQHPYKVRSKVHEAILTKCPIAIEPDDLICGVGASKAFGIEMDYETGIWTPDEVASLKEENYTIEPEEEAELYQFMDRFSKGDLGQTSSSVMGDLFGDDEIMWPFMQSGLLLPPWKSKKNASGGGRAQSGMGLNPMGLYVADFDKFIRRGCRDLINECQDHLKNHTYFTEDSVRQKYFWEGCVTVLEAIIVYANRYADLAAEMSAQEENPTRAAELAEMSAICRRVPEYGAQTFREALQSFWFAFLLLNPSSTAAAGRFDQYMYPYYKKDIEEGRITDDQVLELLEILRLKDFQLNRVSGKILREKNAGMAKWHNWTLGGVDSQGNDATNPLTHMEIQAALEVQTPHHTITIRVHENTPENLMVKGLEVVRAGLGMPCFVGDKSYINFFLSRGVPIEDARQYSMAGCVDGFIAGVTRGQVAAMFIVTLAYDIFMHNGYCPSLGKKVGIETGDVTTFKTFDEYKEAFYTQLHYLLGLASQYFNASIVARRDLTPDFLRSVLTGGCLEEGKEVLYIHQKPYDALTVCSAVGIINVSDSLAAVKKLVYEDKKYTMTQLMEALDANWEGFDELHRDCQKAPKYGNNDDYADSLAAEVYDRYAKSISSYDTICEGKGVPNAISITAHQPGGKSVGATPDGRYKGEILADASMSPAQGRDTTSPTAAFSSAMKIDQDAYQATLMNMKFHPSALKTEEDLRKLAKLIKIYLTNGGKHIQFNIVSKETLLAAQNIPDQHRDLVVRVAGYSAYFVLLTPTMQQEIIDRTSYDTV